MFIVMMFLYASFSKYFDFGAFQRAMYNQPFPAWFSSVLIVILPPIEIYIVWLLVREKSRRKGLIATIFIMSLFTLYIAAILLHFFPKVPCSRRPSSTGISFAPISHATYRAPQWASRADCIDGPRTGIPVDVGRRACTVVSVGDQARRNER